MLVYVNQYPTSNHTQGLFCLKVLTKSAKHTCSYLTKRMCTLSHLRTWNHRMFDRFQLFLHNNKNLFLNCSIVTILIFTIGQLLYQ